jgi:transposase
MYPSFSTHLRLQALEQRRLQAAAWFAEGLTQAEVARRAGVSRQAASRWYRQWQAEGREGLKGPGRAGRKPCLSDAQLRQIELELLKGPRAHGYGACRWTLGQIAEVVRRKTGVSYHVGHIWHLLRKIGWSSRALTQYAQQRDRDYQRAANVSGY